MSDKFTFSEFTGHQGNKVKIIKKLASNGAYSTIFEGVLESTGRKIIIKQLKQEAHIQLYNQREIEALKTITAQANKIGPQFESHILEFIDHFEQTQNDGVSSFKYTLLVTEFCNGGTLETYRKSQPGRKLIEEDVQYVFKQLVKGYDFLRRCGYIHRDLKPDNIFISYKSDQLRNQYPNSLKQSQAIIKIADLGFIRKITDKANSFDFTRQLIPQGAGLDVTKLGTPFFMSPEMHNLASNPDLSLSDLWSLGVIFYNLIFGSMPFDASTETELKAFLAHGTYSIRLSENLQYEYSIECFDLLDSLLQFDANKRINLDDIKKHPFMDEANKLHKVDQIITKKDNWQLDCKDKMFKEMLLLYVVNGFFNEQALMQCCEDSDWIAKIFFE